MSSRVLLLQARRPGDPMAAQERRCFAVHTDLSLEDVEVHDLLEGPPPLDAIGASVPVMMGGSGDFLVSRADLPQFEDLLAFLRALVERGHPTFASCFGFQCMVEALGGEIVYDPGNVEVGTHQVQLTDAGRGDELLGTLPDTFAAQQGHKDRARRLPPGSVHLAKSQRSPYQAFRLPGKPIWATQFHPELSAEANRERYETYLAAYEGHAPEDGSVRFSDSSESNRLLLRFLDLI